MPFYYIYMLTYEFLAKTHAINMKKASIKQSSQS